MCKNLIFQKRKVGFFFCDFHIQGGRMKVFKHLSIGFFSVLIFSGSIGLLMTADSQAGGKKYARSNKKIDKAFYPSCGWRAKRERFVESKDGTEVCDKKTGLRWQQSPDALTFFWEEAVQQCDNLTLNNKKWRLPKVRELQSLVHYLEEEQAAALNAGAFSNVQMSKYWSSTILATDSSFAWTVEFNFGGVTWDGIGDAPFPVWCVRDRKGAHGH